MGKGGLLGEMSRLTGEQKQKRKKWVWNIDWTGIVRYKICPGPAGPRSNGTMLNFATDLAITLILLPYVILHCGGKHPLSTNSSSVGGVKPKMRMCQPTVKVVSERVAKQNAHSLWEKRFFIFLCCAETGLQVVDERGGQKNQGAYAEIGGTWRESKKRKSIEYKKKKGKKQSYV